MATGAVVGYCFRCVSKIHKVTSLIQVVICLLLFILGFSIGTNKLIMGNLANFYISVVIHSKSISYKIHVASKKQIRNKTVFFDNSVFFSFHLISFFALGNI